MHLTHCTLTGVDAHTDPQALTRMSGDYPIAEWGLLYSPRRQGQPGRYPSVEFLHETLRTLPDNVRVALHVCGQGVPDLLSGEAVISKLVAMVAIRGGRVQLNFNQRRDPVSLDALHRLLDCYPSLTVITQHNPSNADLWRDLWRHPNHAVLFDASGGQGISPNAWPAVLPVACGYAGGLGMDNLASALQEIAKETSHRPFWVDMENKLRIGTEDGSDRLDLVRCEECLHIATTSPQPANGRVRHDHP